MYIAARGFVLATIFLTALLGRNPVSYGQEPTRSPTSTPIASSAFPLWYSVLFRGRSVLNDIQVIRTSPDYA